MKLFLDYISKIKFYIILQLFPVMLAEIIFFLYQLPIEPMVYATVFWLITGICACLNGFYRYRKKVEQLELIAAAPDINLSQMDSPVGQDERFQQEIMQQLNQMRIDVENASQKSSEDMTDYYTMWAHQIKTPIAALDILLQNTEQMLYQLDEKEMMQETISVSDMKMELFKSEQYVEMALNYLRVEDISSDLVFKKHELDDMVRQGIRKYAKIFISKKIKMDFIPTKACIVTDEKWFIFVLEQIISNALKYTKKGQISIYMKEKALVIEDTGIGIPAEDLPRIFEKGFTGYNGRENKKSTGIGLYLCKNIMDKLQWIITVDSKVGSGTKIYLTKM